MNKTIFRKTNELIQENNPEFTGLVDLGSCTMHTVHNAFGKGIEQYGKEIDVLCRDLHALFQHSAARQEDYVEVQIDMEVEVHNFQQHTEVRCLSMGPSINRILEQWDAITKFITELAKDQKKVPKSINFKRVYMMLGTKEKASTRVSLTFLSKVIPLFEKFLLLFQKSTPVVHILYDSLCDILNKLFRRFLKPQAMENKYGSDLASVDCTKLQLSDNEIVLGDTTRKALKNLTADQQKGAFLGMRSFFKAAASHLQSKLPLQNELLRQLGCLNPLKKEKKSTLISIQSISSVLQPKVNVTEVVDEWKLYQVDADLPNYNPSERIEVFWNAVFKIQSVDGELRYKLLPVVVRSALVLAQTNAESEQSLSINARIVTKDRVSLREKTIVGLHIVKEAVRFYDPIHNRAEKIPITSELKKSVKAANSAYKERLQRQKEEEEKKKGRSTKKERNH